MDGFINKDAILQALTKEDIITICADLGSQGYKTGSNGELIFQTVCHGGDSWKLYYYHESNGDYQGKMFHCYTKCSDSFNVFELVIRARRSQGISLTFFQALKYVASITNHMIYGKNSESKSQLIDDWTWINRLKRIKNPESLPQLTEIGETILEIFTPYPHELWLEEGISRESMSKYQISYWGEENKIIIPHRDISGRLIGIRGRALNPDDIKEFGKYMPITIEGRCLKHKLGQNLYGLCQNEEAIRRTGKIVLFESEKSVLKCDTFYHQNNFTVAVCGSNLTLTQCRIIRSLNIKEVMIAFDKEYEDANSYEAEIYGNKLKKIASQLTPYCTVYILWDSENLLERKDAPVDKGKDVLEQLMKKKVEVRTNGEVAQENETEME